MVGDPLDRGRVDEFVSEQHGVNAECAQRRRRSKGVEAKRMLADFIVGAHAMLRADRLFTLDNERYATAFPELTLLH